MPSATIRRSATITTSPPPATPVQDSTGALVNDTAALGALSDDRAGCRPTDWPPRRGGPRRVGTAAPWPPPRGARAPPPRRPGAWRRRSLALRPCLGGRGGKPADRDRTLRHRDVELPVVDPEPDDARRGTPQTGDPAERVRERAAVALTSSDGSPSRAPRRDPVTFSAPAGGASGVFSTSGSNTSSSVPTPRVAMAAPTFTANGTRAATPSPPVAVRSALVLFDEHRRGHTGKDRRDPAEAADRRASLAATRSRCRSESSTLAAPGRGHDGHVHARLCQRQRVRHQRRRQRQLHRRWRPGHRHH